MNSLPSHSVNANAESLRSQFVAHEGQKELLVNARGTRYTVDYVWMAREFTRLMGEHVSMNWNYK